MRLDRPFFLLIGVTLFAAIANFNGMTTDAQASSASQPIVARIVDARPPAHAGNPLWAIQLKQLSITRERPIFSPSRRPPPPAPIHVAPAVVQQPVKPPERPAMSLLGTVIGAEEQIGVFLDTSKKNVFRLRVGENHEGWVLRLIKAREASLVKNGEQVVLLELPSPGGASAVAVPTAPPQNEFPKGLPGVATAPIISTANYVDEQPLPARGARP